MQPDNPQDLPMALRHRQPVMNDERESAQTLRLGKASIGTRANKIEDLATRHEILASHQENVMASVSLRLWSSHILKDKRETVSCHSRGQFREYVHRS